MQRQTDGLAWSITINPEDAAPPKVNTVVRPMDTLGFAAAAGMIAGASMAVCAWLHGLDMALDDVLCVALGTLAFAYKFDAFDEPRLDSKNRWFLAMTMPIFANMACTLMAFERAQCPDPLLRPVGLVFVGLLCAQIAFALAVDRLGRLFTT